MEGCGFRAGRNLFRPIGGHVRISQTRTRFGLLELHTNVCFGFDQLVFIETQETEVASSGELVSARCRGFAVPLLPCMAKRHRAGHGLMEQVARNYPLGQAIG